MTITSNILRKDYTANGVNTTFAFDFPIFYESNATPKFSLEVIITDILGAETIKVETTDYTVNYNQTDYVNGVISQGNIVLNTAPTLNYKVSILRKLNFTQNNDITTSGSDALPGTALEGSLDKLTLISLQILENLNRVVKLPKSSQLTNIEFPINSSSANQILAVNNDGNNLTTKDLADIGLAPVSSYIKTLLDDTTSSQARTTLDAQQLNSNLTALAGLNGAADKIPYFTGAGAMALADKGYELKSIQTFTASGTWTKPNGVRAIMVEVQGGGGGGAGVSNGGAGSGGAGGYSKKFITTGIGATETVTIGAGGAGGAGGVGTATSGTAGSTSSFGSHCSATGGGGGTTGGGAGGAGGVGLSGTINLTGNSGNGRPSNSSWNGGDIGINGGASIFGGAGIGGRGNTAGGSAAANSGSGGGVSFNIVGYNAAGGAGAAGIVIVHEYV